MTDTYRSTPPPRTPRPPQKKMSTGKSAAILVGAMVLALALVYGLYLIIKANASGSSDDDSTTSGPDELSAYAVCQQQVEQKLKAPATADFPAQSTATTTRSGDTFTITSYVDAQNSYGAQIRTNWTCTATWAGGDKYNVSAALME